MKRDIYQKLTKWKISSRRKPLILRGARQVGKTYILKDFGSHEYEKIAYFDFEATPDLDDIFKRNLDPSRILTDLSRLQGWEIKPAQHLIIFDEIQASNHALNSLKYFCENAPQYHVAAAGSLLGVKLSGTKSFPVGKVNFLDLYPMTFMEFLSAAGQSGLREMIDTTEVFMPYALPFHAELMACLRNYFFIGGMPEAVKHFMGSGDLQGVREIQKEIIDSFILDFSKHAPVSDIPKLSLIWNSLPSQLARENKKFVFSAVKKSARAREYESALQWLEDTGLIMKSYHVSTAKLPLKGYASKEVFKVFVLDIGILGAMSNIPVELVVKGERLFNEFQGAFVENYVAQQLCSHYDYELYYWKSSGGKAEVDFLIQHEDEVFPLEVKSGINPRSKSLRSYEVQFSPRFLSRTSLLNLKHNGNICNYPLYAISLFPGLAFKPLIKR